MTFPQSATCTFYTASISRETLEQMSADQTKTRESATSIHVAIGEDYTMGTVLRHGSEAQKRKFLDALLDDDRP
jgi:hypothetical protein